LLFKPEVCNGCLDRKSCVDRCPEKAIAFKDRPETVPAGEQVVSECEFIKCAYCGEHFSSTNRVESVAKKVAKGKKVERTYCPLCRRTQLVVNLIETKRKPGSKAEWRSGKDILRRAEERKEQEKKKGKKS